jgi:hypothetical protein
VVEVEEALEDFVVGEGGGPAVGGGAGFVERAMGLVKPGGALVVEIGEGALLQFGFGCAFGIEPGVALRPFWSLFLP